MQNNDLLNELKTNFIEYDKGQMYPIGYLYDVPVKINSEFKGFEWEIKKKGRVR